MDPSAAMKERKLQASLLSIKMFWAPELEKERRSRISERKRADKAETVLKEQLEKGVRYMQKLIELETSYEDLESSSQKQGQLEAELRAQLEDQLQRQTTARIRQYSSSEMVRLEETVHHQDYEIQKREKELIDAHDAIELLQDKLEDTVRLADTNADAAKQMSVLAAELKTARSAGVERDALRLQCNKLRSSVNKLTADLDAAGLARDELRVSLAKVEMRTSTADADAKKSAEQVKLLVGQLDSQALELTQLQAQVTVLTSDKEAAEQALAMAQNEAIDAKQVELTTSLEIERLNTDLSGLLQDIAAKTEECDAGQELTDSLELNLQHLQSKLTDETAAREATAQTLESQHEAMEVLSAELSAEREATSVAKKSLQHQTNLKSKLDEFLLAIQELERQLDAKDDEMARLNAELAASSQASKSSTERSAAQNESRIAGLQADLAAKVKELHIAREQSLELTDRAQQLDAELAAKQGELDAQLAKNKARGNSLTRRNQTLGAEIAALQKKARSTDETTAALQKEIAGLTSKLTAQKKTSATERANRQKLSTGHQAKADEMAAEMAGIRKQIQLQTKENVKLSQRASAAEARATAAESEKEAGLVETRKRGTELDSMAQKLELLRSANTEAKAEAAKLKAEVVDKAHQIRELEAAAEELEERMITEKTNSILALVADLDSQIAALEVDGAEKNQARIEDLLDRRSKNVEELKAQFEKRNALMNPDISTLSASASPAFGERDDLLDTIEVRQTENKGVRQYIELLVGQVRSQGGEIVQAILETLPDLPIENNMSDFGGCTDKEIQAYIEQEMATAEALEGYVDMLLNQILTHCPALLESGSIAIASP